MSEEQQPAPFPGGGPSITEWVARSLAALPIRLTPPAPDPAIIEQRARYRLNRAQRRMSDAQRRAAGLL